MFKKISFTAILFSTIICQSVQAMNCSCISEAMFRNITAEATKQTIAAIKANTHNTIPSACCLAVASCCLAQLMTDKLNIINTNIDNNHAKTTSKLNSIENITKATDQNVRMVHQQGHVVDQKVAIVHQNVLIVTQEVDSIAQSVKSFPRNAVKKNQ